MKTKAPAHKYCRQRRKSSFLENSVLSLHINMYNAQRTDQLKMLVNIWSEREAGQEQKCAVALAKQELTVDVYPY